MTSTIQSLRLTMNSLARLNKIKKDMDPASGITIHVKRGCNSGDDDHDEDYVKVALCGSTEEIMDEIINGVLASLKFWKEAARCDVSELLNLLELCENPGAVK